MNLISIEEHLFFTYNKTGDKKYLGLLKEVREGRKKYLAQIVKNPKGELWCISKHLLSASMRRMEVGTKKLNEGEEKEAKELFKKSYDLWNIFWGLNLGLIEAKDVLAEEDEKEEIKLGEGKKVSVFCQIGRRYPKSFGLLPRVIYEASFLRSYLQQGYLFLTSTRRENNAFWPLALKRNYWLEPVGLEKVGR